MGIKRTKMKKILLIVFALLMVSPVFSQNYRFGFQASPNFSWLKSRTSTLSSEGTILTFSYGLLAEKRIGVDENYYLQMGFVMGSAGGRLSFEENIYTVDEMNMVKDTSTDVRYTYRNRYLEIPVSLKLKTDDIGMFKYFGQLGLEPAFRLGSRAKVEGSPFDEDEVIVNDESYSNYDGEIFEDDVQPIRLSIILGMGIEYTISDRTAAFAAIRFNEGFTNILKQDGLTSKNSYLALQVGVFF